MSYFSGNLLVIQRFSELQCSFVYLDLSFCVLMLPSLSPTGCVPTQIRTLTIPADRGPQGYTSGSLKLSHGLLANSALLCLYPTFLCLCDNSSIYCVVTPNKNKIKHQKNNCGTLEAHKTSSKLNVQLSEDWSAPLLPASEPPLGWQENRRAHKHTRFIFLPLYWFSDTGEGYKDTSAPLLDGLAMLGGVYINENTYICRVQPCMQISLGWC